MKNVIILPCYNEADRLKFNQFQSFINHNPSYQLCFVNDGSTDAPLEKLLSFQATNSEQVTVLDLITNQGKAEAVRQGVLRMTQETEFQNIGFMDADLATGFEDYKRLVAELNQEDKKMVVGSRKMSKCQGVKRSTFRCWASKAVGLVINRLIAMPIKDTQCGAKFFEKTTAINLFHSAFISRWLFDVELFIRLSTLYGETAISRISEVALKSWIEVEGSKLSLRDSLKFPTRLVEIGLAYRIKPRMNAIKEALRVSWSELVPIK